MTQNQLNGIWANHTAGNPPVEGTVCETDADGNDRITVTQPDEIWERKKDETIWRQVLPLRGNL